MHFYVAIAYCLGAGNYRPLMHLPASDILDGCVAHPGVRAVVNLFFLVITMAAVGQLRRQAIYLALGRKSIALAPC
jgi:hypothetical protein